MKTCGLVNLMKHGVLSLFVLLMPLIFPCLSNAAEDYDWHHNGYFAIDTSQSNQYATYMHTTAEIGIGGTYESGVPLKVHGNLRAHGICDENGDNCKDISTGWSTATGEGHSLGAADGSAANVVYVNNIGNVGIETTNPMAKLDVEGNVRMSSLQLGGAAEITQGVNNNNLYITGGNVGIGTMDPVYKLHVDTGSNGYIDIEYDTNQYGGIAFHENGIASGYIQINGTTATDKMEFFVGGGGIPDRKMVIQDDGNVGIGTTNPQSKLAVNGTITAKEIKVTEAGWADFVFEETYELPSLNTVESYIKENKHLPEIPSAKEVQEQGIAVSEMLAKQMQKIEEMTLYLIQLKKENDQLKKRVALLEKVGTPVNQNKMND